MPVPAFEVASVRLSPPESLGMNAHIVIDDSRLDYYGIPLRTVLTQAFGIRPDLLVAPNWLAEVHVDIHGTLPAGSSQKQAPEMLQALLAERFGLKYHHDQRLTPVYKLKAVSGMRPPLTPAKHDAPGRPPQFSGRAGKYLCEGYTMADLATTLNGLGARQSVAELDLNRIVIDATGIEGKYDFTLNIGTPPDDSRTLTQALKDIGLLLEPDRVPFDYIFVDQMMKEPTQN